MKFIQNENVQIYNYATAVNPMNIKPSASIRNSYNEIADLCRESGESVYLTKNGEGDLVVMDIDAFSRREQILRLREHLVAAEEERLNGKSGYSIDQTVSRMRRPGS
jgi:PHD/YefM family antitoxin component YafN of YafNO toxin-antitoxin module